MSDLPITEPTYSVTAFCAAEDMSRTQLYEAWKQGWGPRYYLNGSHRRITHAARMEWQRQREEATQATAAA